MDSLSSTCNCNSLAVVPVVTHTDWYFSSASMAEDSCYAAYLLKAASSVATLSTSIMLVTVLCSIIHHRPTINKW